MTEETITVTLKDREESLKDKIGNLNLEELLKWRKLNENKINSLTEELDKLHKSVVIINRNIWGKCEHKWCRVEGVTFGDLCNKYCEVCKLYNMEGMYK